MKQFISVNIIYKEQGYRARILNCNKPCESLRNKLKFSLHINQKILKIETDTMKNTVKFCIAVLTLFQLVVPVSLQFYTG